jgi:drug/metabolite transporter (DMT)-like permease
MHARQVILFAVLLLVDSMHFIFARLLLPHLAPTASAFYVLAIATLEVGAYAALTRRLCWRAFRPHAGFYLAVGFLVAASTVLSYESVAFLDPGTAALLGKTATLFTVLFGVLWLRERMAPPQAAGALLALAGAFVIAFQPGDYLRLGALLVLASSLLYALHTALVKRYGNEIHFLDFFLFRLLATAGFLGLFAGARGLLVWPSRTALLLLVITGTVDVVLSRTLYYQTLRTLPMSVHSIILTLSPVVAVLLSLVMFGALPTAMQMAGGVLVVLGVLLVSRRPA